MKIINRIFFSVGTMALLIFIFLVALIIGTWLENDYGTQTAKLFIYNSRWLEVLMFWLGINLIVNIFRYRMFRREKTPALVFHLSFLIILIGAGVTRYTGFEGIMPITEGEAVGSMHSADAYVQLYATDKDQQYKFEHKMLASPLSDPYFHNEFQLPNQNKVKFEILEYIPKAVDSVIEDESFNTILEVVVPAPGGGMESIYLQDGQLYSNDGLKITLNNDSVPDAIKLSTNGNQVSINSPYDISFMQMADQKRGDIKKDSLQPFLQRRLHQVNGKSFVFKHIFESASLEKISLGVKSEIGVDALRARLTDGELVKEFYLTGGEKRVPDMQVFTFNGLNYIIGYGAKDIQLPFLVGLRDFKLDYYPGSTSPSSYSSDVVIQDSTLSKPIEFKIYMNHVLDHKGYRFFQSSYNSQGTILSVNHDWWGTNITYLGYLFMGIGMILSLFMKGSRFRELGSKINKSSVKKTLSILLMIGAFSFSSQAQLGNPIDKAHAEKFGELVTQSQVDRLMPMHTVALNILRKIHRADSYTTNDGIKLSPMQAYLDMQINQRPWMDEKMILVSVSDFRDDYDLSGKYVSMHEFFEGDHGMYILDKDVQIASKKSDAEKGKKDKEILKVNDRFQALNMALSGYYTQIYPNPSDTADTWHNPQQSLFRYPGKDSTFAVLQYMKYLVHLKRAKEHGNYDTCNLIVDEILATQRTAGNHMMPSLTQVQQEIWYNKSNIFYRVSTLYSLLGFVLLIVLFIQIFIYKREKGNKIINVIARIFCWLIGIAFILHGTGIILRWYISEHAPWSDGYEALVFISFIVIAIGLFFTKRHKIVLALAAILAFLMLFVAHMDIMNPEIANLVPVLKSYWLKIHVAVITSSYAFLGVGCMLGLLNLILAIVLYFKRKKGSDISHLRDTYSSLTKINEMTVTIGLFVLSIGTFLGGVWANESWGRYWGWDAKETWAFISMLVYSIILHFRFIPGLKSKSVFNFATAFGYLSIMFTFFGVNYLLSGLHSYAKGDPVPIPNWVYIAIAVVIVMGVFAILGEYKNKKRK